MTEEESQDHHCSSYVEGSASVYTHGIRSTYSEEGFEFDPEQMAVVLTRRPQEPVPPLCISNSALRSSASEWDRTHLDGS